MKIVSAEYGFFGHNFFKIRTTDVTASLMQNLCDESFCYVGRQFGDPAHGHRKMLLIQYEIGNRAYTDAIPEEGMFVARPFREEGVPNSLGNDFQILSAWFGANEYSDFTDHAKSTFLNPFEYFRITDYHGHYPFVDPENRQTKYLVIKFSYLGRTYISVAREPDTYIRLLPPAFSVIIATWNREDFLRRCIGSVMSQDFLKESSDPAFPAHRRIEIIVVDDGSTDNTFQVMQDVCRKYPQVCYTKIQHLGCCGLVRNLGVKMSSGRIITYLDSDDRYYPNHLSLIYDKFATTDALVVRAQSDFCSIKKMPDGTINESIEVDFNWKLYKHWGTYPSCIAYRRDLLQLLSPKEFLEDHYPMPARQAGEDVIFWRRVKIGLGLQEEVVEQSTVLYGLIVKGNNITYGVPDVALEYRDR